MWRKMLTQRCSRLGSREHWLGGQRTNALFSPFWAEERVGIGGNPPVCRADGQLRIVVHVRPDVAQSKALQGLSLARRLLTVPRWENQVQRRFTLTSQGALRGRGRFRLSLALFFLKYLFYLFLAALGLCTRGLSIVSGSGGDSVVAVLELLITVASSVAEHGLQSARAAEVVAGNLGSCSSLALEHWALTQ